MPLGAFRLNSLAKFIQAEELGLVATVTSAGVNMDTNAQLTETQYCGVDSSNRPVFCIGYGISGQAGYILFWRINDDASVTIGTPYEVASTNFYNVGLITEQEGHNTWTSTNQSNHGVYGIQTTTGYAASTWYAFEYSRDNLTITSVGSGQTNTVTGIASYAGYIGNQTYACGGRGGNNGRALMADYFTRSGTTLTRVNTTGLTNLYDGGQGSGYKPYGFDNNNYFIGMLTGNNGHGSRFSADRWDGANARYEYTEQSRKSDAAMTQFSAVNKYISLNNTGRMISVGYTASASSGWDNDFTASALDITWNTGSTVPSVSETDMVFVTPMATNRFSLAHGSTDSAYMLFSNFWNGRKWHLKKMTYDNGSLVVDPNWYIFDDLNTSNNDYTNFPNGRGITVNGTHWMTFAVRRSTNAMDILVFKNMDTSPQVERTAKSITFNGNATLSTTQKKWGFHSLYLDGTGDYLSVPHSTDLNLTGDYTVECWIYAADVSSIKMIASKRTSNTGWQFYLNAGKLTWGLNPYPTTGVVTGATTLSINTWYHVVAEKNGTTYTVYVNGTADGSITTSDTMTTTTVDMLIGRDGTNTSRDWNGYIDEFRISTSAKYGGNFTQPNNVLRNEGDTIFLAHMSRGDYNDLLQTRDDNGQQSEPTIL